MQYLVIYLIGVNILFGPSKAHEIAIQYGLSFVVNDAFIGEYVPIKPHVDEQCCLFKADQKVHETYRKEAPKIKLFAGITPGYLVNQTDASDWNAALQELNNAADVILVGNSPTQTVLEQLAAYRSNGSLITKPTIAAQGVNIKTLRECLLSADGAFIGSGLRDENGLVSREKARAIKSLQGQLISGD